MQRLGIGVPLDIDPRARLPSRHIPGEELKRAVENRSHLFIPAQALVADRHVMKEGNIAWVNLEGSFKVAR